MTNLTLHGLWPNRQQWWISYGDCGNAPMNLSKETVSYIGPWMPNFLYEKGFGEHEWRKHGTRQTTLNPDAYFRRAVDHGEAVQRFGRGKYIRQNIGGAISRNTFYEKLKAETGSDAYRDSVKLMCSGQYLTGRSWCGSRRVGLQGRRNTGAGVAGRSAERAGGGGTPPGATRSAIEAMAAERGEASTATR